jgi:hypothetical protein
MGSKHKQLMAIIVDYNLQNKSTNTIHNNPCIYIHTNQYIRHGLASKSVDHYPARIPIVGTMDLGFKLRLYDAKNYTNERELPRIWQIQGLPLYIPINT